jgi:hypothetical protein
LEEFGISFVRKMGGRQFLRNVGRLLPDSTEILLGRKAIFTKNFCIK